MNKMSVVKNTEVYLSFHLNTKYIKFLHRLGDLNVLAPGFR